MYVYTKENSNDRARPETTGALLLRNLCTSRFKSSEKLDVFVVSSQLLLGDKIRVLVTSTTSPICKLIDAKSEMSTVFLLTPFCGR